MKSLLRKSLTQFIGCTVVVLLLATPLFYVLTKCFYAEDLIEIIEAAREGNPLPDTDLEEDMLIGMAIQFVLITCVLIVSLTLMLRFISKKSWMPFDDTLKKMEHFSLEGEVVPEFAATDVKEFARLNKALLRLMENNLQSYSTQREFTENASHELQTPLAIFQGKLDLLLQQPVTERQADIIQDLYEVSTRLARLNRNLLLLARIENGQYPQTGSVDVVQLVDVTLSLLVQMTEGIVIRTDLQATPFMVRANTVLTESLVNNLIVNAVRYNVSGGEIWVSLRDDRFTVSNTSPEKALDPEMIFRRFYRSSSQVKGNGLGLAIVKAICDYHDWKIGYHYEEGRHIFTVGF